MGELFEVKEFDKIIANADFKDDDNFKYLHEDVFNDLVNLSLIHILREELKLVALS